MSANEIHKGDVGTTITITIYEGSTTVDISAANTTTSRVFLLKDSNNNIQTLTASFVGSGTAGGLVFTSTASTFATDGAFELQAVITLGANVFHTDIHKFTVYPNIS